MWGDPVTSLPIWLKAMLTCHVPRSGLQISSWDWPLTQPKPLTLGLHP